MAKPDFAFWVNPEDGGAWYNIKGIPKKAWPERPSRSVGGEPTLIELGDYQDPFSDPPGAMPIIPGVVYINMLVQWAPIKGQHRVDPNTGIVYHRVFPRLAYPDPEKKTPVQLKIADRYRLIDAANMGRWGCIPGEIRNTIYEAVAVGPEHLARIGAQPQCFRGACVHSKLAGAVFPLASVCEGVRKEVMSYYINGNHTFVFDPAAVRNKCSVQWVESLGALAKDVRDIVLEVDVRTQKRAAQAAPAVPVMVPQQAVNGNNAPQTPQNHQNAQWVADNSHTMPPWEKSQCYFKVKMIEVDGVRQIVLALGKKVCDRLGSSRSGLVLLDRLETFVETFNDDTRWCPECVGRKCGRHTDIAILKRVLESKNLENTIEFLGGEDY